MSLSALRSCKSTDVGGALRQIYGVNLTGINLLGSIPDVNSTVDFFGSTAGIRFLGAVANLSGTEGLNATGQAVVAAAPAQLNQTYTVGS